MDGQARASFSLDWRWIVAGYCYLILFHLLPTYLMAGTSVFVVRPVIGEGGTGLHAEAFAVQMVWLLGGVAAVAFVVGWKSKGFTILEPALSGALYALTTGFAFHRLASVRVHDREALAVVLWILIVIILSSTSAWLGEMVQQRKSGKTAESSDTRIKS